MKVRHGRHTYLYDGDRLVAIDAPVRSREWCVEHEAPPAHHTDSGYRQCMELKRRLERGSLSDEPYDCQIVPNLSLDERPTT